MGARITLAGESLIAQKVGAQQPLIVSRCVLANVPSLDPNGPVNRGAPKPPVSQIVALPAACDGAGVDCVIPTGTVQAEVEIVSPDASHADQSTA